MLKYCCNSEERVVKLLIGKEPVKFQGLSWAKDVPLADLDGVQTPPTPCSSDTSIGVTICITSGEKKQKDMHTSHCACMLERLLTGSTS